MKIATINRERLAFQLEGEVYDVILSRGAFVCIEKALVDDWQEGETVENYPTFCKTFEISDSIFKAFCLSIKDDQYLSNNCKLILKDVEAYKGEEDLVEEMHAYGDCDEVLLYLLQRFFDEYYREDVLNAYR